MLTCFIQFHTVWSVVSWHLVFLSSSTLYSVCVATTCLCRCSPRLWRCLGRRRRPRRWVAWGRVGKGSVANIHLLVSNMAFSWPWSCLTSQLEPRNREFGFLSRTSRPLSCCVKLDFCSAVLDIKGILKNQMPFPSAGCLLWLLILQVENLSGKNCHISRVLYTVFYSYLPFNLMLIYIEEITLFGITFTIIKPGYPQYCKLRHFFNNLNCM